MHIEAVKRLSCSHYKEVWLEKAFYFFINKIPEWESSKLLFQMNVRMHLLMMSSYPCDLIVMSLLLIK